uniref:Uncharacterized protein n=1 Tax=Panagrolaimus sp. ES5 TaxID=591445 RepID=A0AC34GKU4_9BILA
MFRISICRCFRLTASARALPDTINQKQQLQRQPSFPRRKNQEDQFGLIGYKLAPQNERYDRYKLDDRFIGGNVIKKEFQVPSTKPKLKQITLPSTMNTKKRKKLEKQQVDFAK